MRNKCLATTARCRICLQEITDIQKHNCSQQPRCAQCDGNHHSLSSQYESIKAYKIQLKEEVDNALARGVIQRSEPTKQVSIFNPDDFPPLSHPNRNNIPVWGSKQLPKHQTTAEYIEITGVLTTLNNQLSIMTEINIRMEKNVLTEVGELWNKFSIPNFYTFHQQDTNRSGGVCVSVGKHLRATQVQIEIENTVIVDVFNLSDPIRIIGIYWPQGQERDLDDLNSYITQETIITGDFNASLEEWNSPASDKC
ncbi:unnamed protein product, partial [Rotaria sp. Silwood2]